MPDEEHPLLVARDRGDRLERLSAVEAAGQRRVDAQHPARVLADGLRRDLGRLARTHPGAEQHGVEARLQPLHRDPGRARLLLATSRQAAIEVETDAVGLGLGVT